MAFSSLAGPALLVTQDHARVVDVRGVKWFAADLCSGDFVGTEVSVHWSVRERLVVAVFDDYSVALDVLQELRSFVRNGDVADYVFPASDGSRGLR